MLNWSDFEVVVAIQESKTLSAAARRLKINQSTVSRILKRMETELGNSVFSSASGTYELTPDGEAYFRVGKEMEKALTHLGSFQPTSQVRGTVRLTTVEALVKYLLSRIGAFNKEFPHISVELNGSNQDANLSRREFHASLRLEREQKSKSLLIKKVGAIGISGYQNRAKGSSSEWIGYESSLASIPEEKWLRAKTKQRRQPLHVSSYLTMESAIERGLGVGLLPRFMGDHNSDIQCITGVRPILVRPVWFMSHPELRRDPAMQSFSNWLFKQFEDDREFLVGRN